MKEHFYLGCHYRYRPINTIGERILTDEISYAVGLIYVNHCLRHTEVNALKTHQLNKHSTDPPNA